ncbi:MAG TPA: glycosyltransferase family 2 protein [Tepidisphaeraceae bacterium]|jgi:GT2 family glycosyltransferase
MLDLSIILPTCNRATLLEKCLASLSNLHCEHEIIVVDGASTDHTPDVLSDATRKLGSDRLKVIHESSREGFVRAANRGFRAAQGRCMTWLNDDARPLRSTLESAIQILDGQNENVAFVAMFHAWQSTMNVAFETEHRGRMYRLCHVRGTLYANFPMGYRETYHRLNYFDERFFFCGADPDLSLKAWYAGMTIVPAWGCMIDHDQTEDDRRAEDVVRRDEDNRRLFSKWDLPPKNMYHNDFDAARPCTLRCLPKPANVAIRVAV